MKNSLQHLFLFSLVLMLLLQSCRSSRHTKVDYITLDFLKYSKDTFEQFRPVNDMLGIKIVNLNRNIYIVNSTITSENYYTTRPDLFAKFSETPVPEISPNGFVKFDLNIDILSGTRNVLNFNIEEINKLQESITSRMDAMDSARNEFINDYSVIMEFIKYHKSIVNLVNDTRSFDSIEADFMEMTVRYLRKADRELLNIDTNSTHELKAAVEMILHAHCTKLITLYPKLLVLFSDPALDALHNDIEELNKKLGEVIADSNFSSLAPEVRNKLMGLKTSVPTLKKIVNDWIDWTKSNQLNQLHKNIITFSDAGIFNLLSDFDKIKVENFTYFISPVAIEKDETVFKIDVTPKPGLTNSLLMPRTYEYKIRAKGGVKIDFSTGIVGSFGEPTFYDQTYRYKNYSTDTLQIIRNKNRNIMYPGVIALMHVYGRDTDNIQPSFSVGLSTKGAASLN
ncbi:MAG: hypothetical protein M3Q56_05330, partial [Bacteroidota bacterium]|nr:hypothetical protein [Bacteroidota bacterium]